MAESDVDAVNQDLEEGAEEPQLDAEPSPIEPVAADPSTIAGAARRAWPLLSVVGAMTLLFAGLATAIATAPEPDHEPSLQRVEELLGQDRYSEAIEALNKTVLPYVGTAELDSEQKKRYHVLAARALWGGNADLVVRQAINDEGVVDQYLAAESFGGGLGAEDISRLVDSLVELRQFGAASERVETIPDEHSELRFSGWRRLIEGELAIDFPAYREILGQLASVLADGALLQEHRIWALAKQAEVRHRLGRDDETVTQLLREMPLLVGVSEDGLAGLRLALARAYLAIGEYRDAASEAGRVEESELARAGGPLGAQAKLLLAEASFLLAQDEEAIREARRLFDEVVESESATDAYLPALLGLAEVESELQSEASSRGLYRRLVEEWVALPRAPESPRLDEIVESLLERFEERLAVGQPEGAIVFAALAGEMFDSLEATPPLVLEALAVGHRARALQILGIEQGESGSIPDFAWEVLVDGGDESTHLDAKRNLIRSASYFRAHADRFVIDDLEKFADSLWAAGVLFDRAGDKSSAISAFLEFAESRPNDPRRAEARFRLGQAYQALGQYEIAAEYYRQLADEKRTGQSRVGDWADRSLVPLAQCYVRDGDAGNDDQAEEILAAALSGQTGGPEREEYRDALLELGRLMYRRDRFAEAVERFEELVSRWPEGRAADAARFSLADSYRRLAGGAREAAEEVSQPSLRRDLELQASQHLRRALELFELVRDSLGSRRAGTLSPLEALQLRNAHFYLGDCAYDLGDLDAAISYYSAARASYPDDPAVLVALIQIVNVFLDKGELASARTANERARDFFNGLPDSVWDDPNLPMDRDDWARWLDSSSALYDEIASGG